MITRTSLENQSENKSLDINVLDFTIHIYTMLFLLIILSKPFNWNSGSRWYCFFPVL